MQDRGSSVPLPALAGMLAALTFVAPVALALDGETLIRQGAATPVTIDAATSGLPIKLNRRGRYKLASNIVVPSTNRPNAPRCGIEITSVDVELDLNGFALLGENGQAAVGICIRADSATVTNGTISGFGNAISGIDKTDLAPNGPSYVRIENNRIVKNALGIRLSGKAHVIKANTISDTGVIGIDCGSGCAVTGNVVMDSTRNGIQMHSGLAVGNYISGHKIGLACSGSCGYSQNTFAGNGANVDGASAAAMNPNAL